MSSREISLTNREFALLTHYPAILLVSTMTGDPSFWRLAKIEDPAGVRQGCKLIPYQIKQERMNTLDTINFGTLPAWLARPPRLCARLPTTAAKNMSRPSDYTSSSCLAFGAQGDAREGKKSLIPMAHCLLMPHDVGGSLYGNR